MVEYDSTQQAHAIRSNEKQQNRSTTDSFVTERLEKPAPSTPSYPDQARADLVEKRTTRSSPMLPPPHGKRMEIQEMTPAQGTPNRGKGENR